MSALLLALALAGASGTATSTTGVEAHTDNANGDATDDDFGLVRERADLQVSSGELSTAARIDGALFAPVVDGGGAGEIRVGRQLAAAAYANQLQLERASVAWSPGAVWFLDDVALTAGDSPLSLGRGVVLSLRPVDAIGADTALRGARADLAVGPLALVLGAGLADPANVDAVSLHHVDDPLDLLGGTELRLTLRPGLDVGGVGSFVLPRERLLPDQQDGTVSGGAFVTWSPLDALTLGFEADAQERTLAGTFAHGGAFVADSTLALGDVTVLLEALWLGNWQVRGSENTATGARFDYAQPPTLERIDQDVQSTTDVGATRARIDVATPIATVFVSGMGKVGSPFATGAEVVQAHVFIGAERAFDASHINGTIGARDERLGLEKLAPLKRMLHLDLDGLLDVGNGFALHSTSSTQLWDARGNVFVRGSTLFAAERAVGSVGVELGYDTQDPSPDVRHAFLAGIVAFKPAPFLELRAVGGSQRGGTKCMAGVCREWPSFSGFKLEAIATY